MRRTTLFILIAFSSFTLGIIVSLSWSFISDSRTLPSGDVPASRLNKQSDEASNFDLTSEISFQRIYDGCEGCGDRKIVFQRDASKKFEDATVIETDLDSKTERHGKLNPYYFNHLLTLIEEQGYFSMSDEYAMGWVDSTMVSVRVRIGDKHKVIKTSNEGDVPIQLWGIYYAIEGAWAKVEWQTSSAQSNKTPGADSPVSGRN